ncbi:uncharacterized protein J3D65DRAFT_625274 [Phyllosticta citribraziliensis]|uniref:Secreted protein n=1 Tax=Phyllosticta citribraziliensis TaxID=989973 RepID=A0ABR1LRN6_9PEZI
MVLMGGFVAVLGGELVCRRVEASCGCHGYLSHSMVDGQSERWEIGASSRRFKAETMGGQSLHWLVAPHGQIIRHGDHKSPKRDPYSPQGLGGRQAIDRTCRDGRLLRAHDTRRGIITRKGPYTQRLNKGYRNSNIVTET